MYMIWHSPYLNWGALNASNSSSDICEYPVKNFFTHLHARALDMENQMNIYFY